MAHEVLTNVFRISDEALIMTISHNYTGLGAGSTIVPTLKWSLGINPDHSKVYLAQTGHGFSWAEDARFHLCEVGIPVWGY